jgi:hypothetical protein
MDELVIDIGHSGKVEAMYSDDLNLGFLGAQTVTRASEILFDVGSQRWNIVPTGYDGVSPLPRYAMGFASYEQARAFEVRWFNACRLAGVSPLSEEGAKQAKIVAYAIMYSGPVRQETPCGE